MALTLKQRILRERAMFYAFRIMPDGRRVRLATFGRRTFGRVGLAWLKARAKRLGWRIIVKRIAGTTPTWRERLVMHANWALEHEGAIHYQQARPFNPRDILNRKLPLTGDCSSTATMLYRAAGAPDPNGLGYNGTGYTGTLRSHLPRKRLEALKPGDLIVYGSGTGKHVVVVMRPGPDPVVWSHGQESGPRLYRHSVQVAAHGRTFTCHGYA